MLAYYISNMTNFGLNPRLFGLVKHIKKMIILGFFVFIDVIDTEINR